MDECRVEIGVTPHSKSLGLQRRPTAVKINGTPIPHVVSVDVQYHANDIRKVVITLIPTDVVEVPAEMLDKQTPPQTLDNLSDNTENA